MIAKGDREVEYTGVRVFEMGDSGALVTSYVAGETLEGKNC